MKGRKPKSARLHLVDGTRNTTRHGTEKELRSRADHARNAFAPLTKPRSLKGQAAKAWKRWIEPAHWLDGSREPAAIAFCELFGEFMLCPANFQAARHAQLRAYQAELGLTDERNRADKPEDENDEFFD